MKKLANAKTNPSLWKTTSTCTGKGWIQIGTNPCYALWEIDASDILKRTHTDISGDTEAYYGFICPDCGCFTEIDVKDIPYEVRSGAKNYAEREKEK